MACSDPFLLAELKAIEEAITAYNAALLAFATNGAIISYTLDTGQTRQVVTRAEIGSMRNLLNYLNSKRDDLVARLGCDGDGRPIRGGRGGRYVRPL